MQSTGIKSAQLLMEVLAGAHSRIGQEISKSDFSIQLSDQHQLIQNRPVEQSASSTEPINPLSPPPVPSKEVPSSSPSENRTKLFGQSGKCTKMAKRSPGSARITKNLVLARWEIAQELTVSDLSALETVLTQLHLAPSVKASVKDAVSEEGKISLQSLSKILDRTASSGESALSDARAPSDDLQNLLAGILQQQYSLSNLKELGIRLKRSYNLAEFRDLLRLLVDKTAGGSLENGAKSALPQTGEATSSAAKSSTTTPSDVRPRLANQTGSLNTIAIPSFLKEEQESPRNASKQTGNEAPHLLKGEFISKSSITRVEENGRKDQPLRSQESGQFHRGAAWQEAEAKSGQFATAVSTTGEMLLRTLRSGSEAVSKPQSPVLPEAALATQPLPVYNFESSGIMEKETTLPVNSNQDSAATLTASVAGTGEWAGRGLRPVPSGNDLNLGTQSVEGSPHDRTSIPTVEKIAASGDATLTPNHPRSFENIPFRSNAAPNSSPQAARTPFTQTGSTQSGDVPITLGENTKELFKDVIRLQMTTQPRSVPVHSFMTGNPQDQPNPVPVPSGRPTPEGTVSLRNGQSAEGQSDFRLNPITNSTDGAKRTLPGKEFMPNNVIDSSRTNSRHNPELSYPADLDPGNEPRVLPAEMEALSSEAPKSPVQDTVSVRESSLKSMPEIIYSFEDPAHVLTKDQNGSDLAIRGRYDASRQSFIDAASPERTRVKAVPFEVQKTARPSLATGTVENPTRTVQGKENNNPAQNPLEKPPVAAAVSATEAPKPPVQDTVSVREGSLESMPEIIYNFEDPLQVLTKEQNGSDPAIRDRYAASRQSFIDAASPESTRVKAVPFEVQKTARPSSATETVESPTRTVSGKENNNPAQAPLEKPSVSAAVSAAESKSNIQAPISQVSHETQAEGTRPRFQNSVELLANSEKANEATALKSAPVPERVADQGAQTTRIETGESKDPVNKTIEKPASGQQTANHFTRQEQNRDPNSNLLPNRDGLQMPSLTTTPGVQKGADTLPLYESSLPMELARRIQELHSQKRNRLTLELEPRHWGRLVLRIDTEANQVKAVIATESEQTKEILSRGMSQLRQELASQGLVLEQLQINVNSQSAAREELFQRQTEGSSKDVPNRRPGGKTKEAVLAAGRKTYMSGADTLISLFV